MTRLLILGAPGSGKGTQGAKLADEYGIPAIATGDIFRHNIRTETELGVKVKEIVDAGDYVPDGLVNELVRDRLGQSDAVEGFLLDGYPRTLDQVRFLDEFLAARGQSLDGVIQLVADTDEVVGRLGRRAVEQGRMDDSEQAIRHRLDVFDRETAPLVAVYSERGLLIEVDGLGEIDEVASRIRAALHVRGLGPLAPASTEEATA